MSSSSGSESPPHGELDLDRLVSGESGTVTGPRARSRARVQDLLDDAALWCKLVPPRLERDARRSAHGKVHVLGLYSAGLGSNMARTVMELSNSRRQVEFALGAIDGANEALASQTAATGLHGGKFENLNSLLEHAPAADA
jgi:hypothetical protein